MKRLPRTGRHVPTHFPGGVVFRRQVGSVMLGGAALLLFAPCGAFAQSSATIELSPTVANSTLLSAMDPAKEITIQLALPLSDAKGAQEFTNRISDPKDPLFRHFITVKEFAARFGGNVADFAAVKAWAVANGLSIQHQSAARTSLTVRGTVAQMESLFKTQLSNYRSSKGDEFYSASVKPTIPNELAPKIYGVVGLTGGVQKAPLYKMGKVIGENPETAGIHTDTAGGTGPGGTYAPSDLKKAYLIPTFGGVIPQTVAVFEQGGITASDLTTFESHYKLPNVTVTQTGVAGSDTNPNGSTTVEVDLDIQTIIGLNPKVKEIDVYVADYAEVALTVGLVDTFDAVASSSASVLSVSYGLDEVTQGITAITNEYNALLEVVDAGISVLISAGDNGAYGRTGTDTDPATLNVSDPGSQPLATCVGGTTLFTGPQQQYAGEEVWNDLGISDGATGGGISSVWPRPSNQVVHLVRYNGGSRTNRNVPDVGALANPLTGFGVYTAAAGGWIQVGGTSLSAPIWASYVSILQAGVQYVAGYTGPAIGSLNGILYDTTYSPFSSNFYYPAGHLSNVLDGSNGNYELYGTAGFNAGLYYNNCTGIGSLWGPHAYQVLIDTAQKSPPPAVTNLTATPSTTSAIITWTKAKGAHGYAVFVDLLSASNLTYTAQTLVTKGNSVTVKGLVSGGTYSVFVASVNATGSTQTDVEFTTP